MARIRDPNRDAAHEIYKSHYGDITNRAIADQLGVDEKKVAVWKSRDKWNVVQQSDNKTKSVVQQSKKQLNSTKLMKPTAEKIEEVANDDLTDKQRLFCIYYLKYFNATKAYQKAYECDYATAMASGSRMLRNVKVSDEIDKLREERMHDKKLSIDDIIQKYMDIAFADITDFMEFGSKEEPYLDDSGNPLIDSETGEPLTYKRNYLYLNNSDQIDGTIIIEVKQGKSGVSVKLADRMEAMKRLEPYVGYMSEEQKARIALLNSKIPNNNTVDINSQITALADLINNPAAERVMPDD